MKRVDAAKEFEKTLATLARPRKLAEVFEDFLDYALLKFRWTDLKPAHFAVLEKKYPTKEEHILFANALYFLGQVAGNDGEGFQDVFGEYYMTHFPKESQGQFFTPDDVCDLIVRLTQLETAHKGSTICDPACGSGGTLLAAAKVNRYLYCYGSDIDLTCCKMAVINFLYNVIPGEIAWMNTLTMEHWRSWHIKRIMDGNGKYIPYYTVSGPGETRFVNILQNTLAQGNTVSLI